MRVTRRSFVAGVSAAVLADWPTGVFAEGAARPFGAGKRVPGDRIRRLLAQALDHDVRPPAVPVQYDPTDMNLPEPVRIGKRLKEYISAQPVTLRADEEMVGWLSFDGSVPSDIYPRIGHKAFAAAASKYYLQPQDALATFEWQHSSIDYPKLIKGGLNQIRAEIEELNLKRQSQRLAVR